MATACHYCAQCGRGCRAASNFSSSQVMIPPARRPGRFTMIANAMAREILVGKDGKAEGVSYIDKGIESSSGLCEGGDGRGSACESARLLLNSRTPRFPDGLANSSGGGGAQSHGLGGQRWRRLLPAMEKMPSTTTTASAACTCTCRGGSSMQKNEFLRGYHIEFWRWPRHARRGHASIRRATSTKATA